MGISRMEACSADVIAIIITIMALALKVLHGAGFNDLMSLAPVFISAVCIGIYWNNLHCFFRSVRAVRGLVPSLCQ